VAEFDKAMLLAKLAGARQRKRKLTGKCEGRKFYAEAMPETSPWQRLCAARAVCGRSAPPWRSRVTLRLVADSTVQSLSAR
jgi:hypothetical protein